MSTGIVESSLRHMPIVVHGLACGSPVRLVIFDLADEQAATFRWECPIHGIVEHVDELVILPGEPEEP